MQTAAAKTGGGTCRLWHGLLQACQRALPLWTRVLLDVAVPHRMGLDLLPAYIAGQLQLTM
jgi:hypothetical protein